MFDLDKIALFDNMLWLNHVNVVLFYVKVVPKVVGAGLSKILTSETNLNKPNPPNLKNPKIVWT